MRRLFLAMLVVALGAGLGGCAAVTDEGLRNALRPTAAGLHEIAPDTFVDDSARAVEARQKLASARKLVAGFFGAQLTRPRVILCTRAACKTNFLPASGLHGKTWGYQLVVLDAEGFNTRTMAHELAHVELHRIMGAGAVAAQRIPAWFDEGLASWVSQDSRLKAVTPGQMTRIKQARQSTQWGQIADQMGWLTAYAAANALVSRVAEAAGPEAIRTMLTQVAAGADFDTLWARLPGAL